MRIGASMVVQGQRRLCVVSGVSRKERKVARAAASVPPLFDFREKAEEVLVHIDKALQPLVPLNDVFTITKSKDEVTVLTGKGQYSFKVNHSEETLFVASPMSGNFNYNYDASSGHWLGTHDNHDMRGLVTRDLLRHATGLPAFD